MQDLLDNNSFSVVLAIIATILSPILLMLTWIWAKISGNDKALSYIKTIIPGFVTKSDLNKCKVNLKSEVKEEVYMRMGDIVNPIKESNTRIESNLNRLHQRLDEALKDNNSKGDKS